MKIALTGGTGFVGNHLTAALLAQDHEVFILTRNKEGKTECENLTYIQWLNPEDEPEIKLEGIDVFINLSGESINSGRWTQNRKLRILESRISSTKEVLRIISRLEEKPYTLINASAVGYYGTSVSEVFTEEDQKSGDDFLAETVKEWEAQAKLAVEWEIRTVFSRFGIILDKDNGALPKMALPYKMLAGGTIGSGQQWLSWIHIDDVVQAMIYIINNEQLKGPVNFTAPSPVTMKEFGQTLSKVLNKPHWMPVPESIVKVALGEMSLLITKGQKVLPNKLADKGYTFLYDDLKSALQAIYD
ncbi:TIGR01777 family oxidoreductase [Cytobacillus purgationiresistens]|uniref:Uncharacterized protein (TIGR01777 family) n=1 Tax=Cytobacillus purgationiresistens TaxID=863449 RepID=A0ABU0AT61_9BACI|nr:TIGR01777 family oxidoreductase [Cytobacillus purgationiresistens]MDQ0273618.1 uncharacterized protein (TIGR01777 family) [Cytobacillus purgationiresistens]